MPPTPTSAVTRQSPDNFGGSTEQAETSRGLPMIVLQLILSILLLVISALIFVWVALGIFGHPITTRLPLDDYVSSVGMPVVLTLSFLLLYMYFAPLFAIQFSCGVNHYSVPALLHCEDSEEKSISEWQLHKNTDDMPSLGFGRKFSINIAEPGTYDVWHIVHSAFPFVSVAAFSSGHLFYFGVPSAAANLRDKEFQFTFNKKGLTKPLCDSQSFNVGDDEQIRYFYIKEVQVLNANTSVIRIDQSTVIVSVCLGLAIAPLQFVFSLGKASGTGLLVLGVEKN
jgi:hypothetical protein